MYGQHELVFSHEAYACSLVIMYWIDFCFWPVLLWIYCIICFHEFAVCLYKKYLKNHWSQICSCLLFWHVFRAKFMKYFFNFYNFSVITGWSERKNKYCKKIIRFFCIQFLIWFDRKSRSFLGNVAYQKWKSVNQLCIVFTHKYTSNIIAWIKCFTFTYIKKNFLT